MEDLDVRSALTSYVTDDEPPIGLTTETVLAAGRRSRRRRMAAAVAGAALAVAAIVGTTFVIAVPWPGGQVAGPVCPDKTRPEAPAQTNARLSCAVGNAVRAVLPPDSPIERLTIPGEAPHADPFELISMPPEEPVIHHMGVRVDTGAGPGSVYVVTVGVANPWPETCKSPERTPTECLTRRFGDGLLQEAIFVESGLITYESTYYASSGTVTVTANNSGVLKKNPVPDAPPQSPVPPLTRAQVTAIATTSALVP